MLSMLSMLSPSLENLKEVAEAGLRPINYIHDISRGSKERNLILVREL